MLKRLVLFFFLLFCLQTQAQTCCGSAAYCSKRFDEMVFVSTHNAYSHKKGPHKFMWPNQTHNVKRQLNDGVRNLMLDVYETKGKVWLYHMNPKLGKELLAPVLHDIKAFLDSNKGEIVSIIFQNAISNERIAKEIMDAGLDGYCLVQAIENPWPTLGEMVSTNKRLVLFVETDIGNKVPYIHNAWDYIFDTPWNTKTLAEMDTRLGRGKQAHGLFLLNNWISKGKPKKSNAQITNSEQFLLDRIGRCAKDLHRVPNFIGLNFYEQGDAVKVAKMLNDGLRDALLK